MKKEEIFTEFLQEISANIPKDAFELRGVSDKIISKWINLKFEYPHEMIDPFVYIESSIEDSIEGSASNSVKLENECSEAYAFHIAPFLRALVELQALVEEHKLI